MDLDCYTYKLILKDAFVHKLSETEEGRDYLEDAYLIRQTSPDRKKLREKFGSE